MQWYDSDARMFCHRSRPTIDWRSSTFSTLENLMRCSSNPHCTANLAGPNASRRHRWNDDIYIYIFKSRLSVLSATWPEEELLVWATAQVSSTLLSCCSVEENKCNSDSTSGQIPVCVGSAVVHGGLGGWRGGGGAECQVCTVGFHIIICIFTFCISDKRRPKKKSFFFFFFFFFSKVNIWRRVFLTSHSGLGTKHLVKYEVMFNIALLSRSITENCCYFYSYISSVCWRSSLWW